MTDPRLARLDAQVDFLKETDKLKSVLRATPLIDGSRRENSAEHMKKDRTEVFYCQFDCLYRCHSAVNSAFSFLAAISISILTSVFGCF